MFRLGLISDSHGNWRALERAAKALSSCDALAHMGDGVTDAKKLAALTGKAVHCVRGNCDNPGGAPEEMVIALEGYKLLICHGHCHGVKRSLTALSLRAQEAGANIALYGHTHVPKAECAGGTLFVNPGALMNGYYGLIEFRENGAVPILRTL